MISCFKKLESFAKEGESPVEAPKDPFDRDTK